jgi:plastocyanin
MIALRLALLPLLALSLVVAVRVYGAGGGAREATIAIRYSHFEPAVVEATAGEPITITLRNDDPIAHEWMVGDAAMHERHRTGTEPYHNTVPTEVTVPAYETRVTTVTFAEPGDYKYICHLPNHEAYGMVGVLRVVAP